MQVGIVSYGAGNVRSVHRALYMAGADPILVSEPEELLSCDRLLLPGVGAAAEAMGKIRERNLDSALTEFVEEKARPLLGICLGMQLLMGTLHEFGSTEGLGWIEGDVVALDDVIGTQHLQVPHMGWNDVEPDPSAQRFFRGVGSERCFYFAHSFTALPADETCIAARTDYGVPLAVALMKGSAFATQFHPEKSQIDGLRLIENFLDWNP